MYLGQCVNFKKLFFFSKNTVESMRLQVAQELGVRYSSNPEQYLGLPNIVGRH